MQGWIKLHRQLLEWEWFSDSNVLSVFMYLLLSANSADGRWQGKKVLAGQHISSIPKISNATGLSEKKVRTALKKLQSTGEIISEGAYKHTLITIVKWADFQHSNNGKGIQGADKGHPKGGQEADKGHSRGGKQEEKELEKERIKDIYPPTPQAGESENKKMLSAINDAFTNGDPAKDILLEWLQYKREKKQAYKPTGLNQFINKLKKMISERGYEAVESAIRETMANGWQGVVWDRVESRGGGNVKQFMTAHEKSKLAMHSGLEKFYAGEDMKIDI